MQNLKISAETVSSLDNAIEGEFIEKKAKGWNRFPTIFIVLRTSKKNVFVKAKLGSTSTETVKHADFAARFVAI